MFSRCIQSSVSVFLIAIVILSFPVCVGKGTTFFRLLQATTGETWGENPSRPLFSALFAWPFHKKKSISLQAELYITNKNNQIMKKFLFVLTALLTAGTAGAQENSENVWAKWEQEAQAIGSGGRFF